MRPPTPRNRTAAATVIRLLVPAIFLLHAAVSTATAADHFLAIGGGNAPSNTQVSLEKNILFFRDALSTLGLASAPQQVLFADGNGNADDVQFAAGEDQTPEANRRLADVFSGDDADSNQYRPHAIPNVWGPAQRESLDKWFDTIGKTIPDGDRLILYYTGHGGPGESPTNTTLALWNEQGLTVKSLTRMLDRLRPGVSVVLVMVQCFSGGFANVIYQDADPTRGLSDRNRCGFFATTSDREAAGCTPDIDLEDYREYSTYFWAALCGHTRTGKPVVKPDFLADGHIGLSEAHAYTLIHSETIDIPVTTSDAFLRQFSRLATDPADGLMSSAAPYDQLIKSADPPHRAVLDGLSQALALSKPDRLLEAQKLADDLTQRRSDIEQRQRRLTRSIRTLRDIAQSVLQSRWPALANPTSAAAQQTISSQGPQIVAMLHSSISYDHLRAALDQSDKLDDDDLNLERQWVKCQRFINTAESVALAANVPAVCSPELQQRYHRLIAAENAALAQTPR
jgi:hypothetical protein